MGAQVDGAHDPHAGSVKVRADRRVAEQPSSRTTVAWVTLASWSIVSLVMTGPSSLSRESRPAHQPISAGLGARLCRRLWITPRRVEGCYRLLLDCASDTARRNPCSIDCSSRRPRSNRRTSLRRHRPLASSHRTPTASPPRTPQKEAETDVPHTDVPHTDVPHTDVPHTDVPHTSCILGLLKSLARNEQEGERA
jgi:hypothetical protein